MKSCKSSLIIRDDPKIYKIPALENYQIKRENKEKNKKNKIPTWSSP